MKAQPKSLAVSRQIILVSFKAQVPFQVRMFVLSLSRHLLPPLSEKKKKKTGVENGVHVKCGDIFASL